MIGIKQLYIAIVLPSFFELDKYPAIHRSNFLVRVYSVKGKRGTFEFWNWEKKKKLYLFGKKGYDYQCVQPNFRGTFPKKAFPFDKEYDERKIAALGKMTVSFRDFNTKAIKQRNELIKYLYNNVGLKQLEISEITSRSEETLSQKAISEVINEKS